MSTETNRRARPPVLAEYIRLPNRIATGRYDDSGRRIHDEHERVGGPERPRLYLTVLDTAFLWGVFSRKLKPGECGHMTFTNAPGTFLVGVSFTEWDPSCEEPVISDGSRDENRDVRAYEYLSLISGERGRDLVRVTGRNHYRRPVYAAVGIVLADFASY